MAGKDVLRRHLAVLERRIEEARVAKQMVEHALACPLDLDECPHAAGLRTEPVLERP